MIMMTESDDDVMENRATKLRPRDSSELNTRRCVKALFVGNCLEDKGAAGKVRAARKAAASCDRDSAKA